MTIGDQAVETQNLAYTLQGWIKGVKGEHFSYALGYYAGDYSQTGTGLLATPVNKSLYNGNIATMTTKFSEAARTQTVIPDVALLTQQFEYDQLNRIKKSTRLTSDGLPNQNANSYATNYTYDGNGNIQSLYRYDMAGTEIDHLSYNYELKSKGYQATTNKLRWVDDNTTAAYTAGAKDQDADNFGYDDIGNLRRDLREGIGTIEWTIRGKVRKVMRASTGDNTNNNRPNLFFAYDPSGNRVSKTVSQPTGASVTTFYVRDATGNVMGIYEQANSGLPVLSELDIYGSNRLGLFKPSSDLSTSVGLKSYEIGDHQGNVSVVLSDIKATIRGVTGYYPFGMAMGGRNGSMNFRYGFQRQEKDADFNDCYDFKYRTEDPRIARFLSIDPIANKYSYNSPYAFSENSPIAFIELEGLEKSWYQNAWDNTVSAATTAGNKVTEVNSKYQVTTRLIGAVQVVGGTLEASAGAAGLCAPTGVTQVAGAVLVVHGADNVQAGLMTMIYGAPQSTLTNQTLQKAGLSEGQATVVELTLSVGAGGMVYAGTKTSLPALTKPLPITKSALDKYRPNQGFTGVYDKTTGKIAYKASNMEAVPITLKDGTIMDDVVKQLGGHGPVADAMGGDRASKLGFSILKTSETEIKIGWNSQTLNGQGVAREMPTEFKNVVMELIKKEFPNYKIIQ